MTKLLITGGGGFLGTAIVKKALDQGYTIRVINRSKYPELEKLGVECIQADITQYSKVLEASRGCDAIIHTAAKAGVWGEKEDYEKTNIDATKYILDACRVHRIKHLVYTSSPSVVFDGKPHQASTEESLDYPKKYLAHYPRTKARAELLVLAASSEHLASIALRPHLIWGPDDPHLAPRILERARQNRLVIAGSGGSLVDSVYVDNAADAHLLALQALMGERRELVRGQAYFVTNQEPWPLIKIIQSILLSAGSDADIKKIPTSLAFALAGLVEGFYKVGKLRNEPPLTRFVVQQLSLAHWYSAEKIKQHLGYQPKISMKEGMRRLAAYYQREPQFRHASENISESAQLDLC